MAVDDEAKAKSAKKRMSSTASTHSITGSGVGGGGSIGDPSLDIDAALPSDSELDPRSKKSMRFTGLDDSSHAAIYGDDGVYNSSSSSVGIQQSITAAAHNTGLSGSALMAEIQHSVEQHFHALDKVRLEQEEARHEAWLKYVEEKLLRDVHVKLDQQHNALSGVIAHMNQLAHRLDNLESKLMGNK